MKEIVPQIEVVLEEKVQIFHSTMQELAEEFRRLKSVAKDLRKQKKEVTILQERYKEGEDLKKKLKVIKEEIEAKEEIHDLDAELKTTVERQKLIKEMIRIRMIEDQLTLFPSEDEEIKLVYKVEVAKSKRKKRTK